MEDLARLPQLQPITARWPPTIRAAQRELPRGFAAVRLTRCDQVLRRGDAARVGGDPPNLQRLDRRHRELQGKDEFLRRSWKGGFPYLPSGRIGPEGVLGSFRPLTLSRLGLASGHGWLFA